MPKIKATAALYIILLFSFFISDCTDEVRKKKVKSSQKLTGFYRGSIIENKKKIGLKLVLRERDGELYGDLWILSKTDGEIKKGTSIGLTQIKRSRNTLSFIVSITGKIDDDSIRFVLKRQNKNLIGYGQEMRKGSEKKLVNFKKIQ